MKKIIALVLALVMTLSLLPMNVWATDVPEYTGNGLFDSGVTLFTKMDNGELSCAESVRASREGISVPYTAFEDAIYIATNAEVTLSTSSPENAVVLVKNTATWGEYNVHKLNITKQASGAVTATITGVGENGIVFNFIPVYNGSGLFESGVYVFTEVGTNYSFSCANTVRGGQTGVSVPFDAFADTIYVATTDPITIKTSSPEGAVTIKNKTGIWNNGERDLDIHELKVTKPDSGTVTATITGLGQEGTNELVFTFGVQQGGGGDQPGDDNDQSTTQFTDDGRYNEEWSGVFVFTELNDGVLRPGSGVTRSGENGNFTVTVPCQPNTTKTVYLAVGEHDGLAVTSGESSVPCTEAGTWLLDIYTHKVYAVEATDTDSIDSVTYTVTRTWNQTRSFTLVFDFSGQGGDLPSDDNAIKRTEEVVTGDNNILDASTIAADLDTWDYIGLTKIDTIDGVDYYFGLVRHESNGLLPMKWDGNGFAEGNQIRKETAIGFWKQVGTVTKLLEGDELTAILANFSDAQIAIKLYAANGENAGNIEYPWSTAITNPQNAISSYPCSREYVFNHYSQGKWLLIATGTYKGEPVVARAFTDQTEMPLKKIDVSNKTSVADINTAINNGIIECFETGFKGKVEVILPVASVDSPLNGYIVVPSCENEVWLSGSWDNSTGEIKTVLRGGIIVDSADFHAGSIRFIGAGADKETTTIGEQTFKNCAISGKARGGYDSCTFTGYDCAVYITHGLSGGENNFFYGNNVGIRVADPDGLVVGNHQIYDTVFAYNKKDIEVLNADGESGMTKHYAIWDTIFIGSEKNISVDESVWDVLYMPKNAFDDGTDADDEPIVEGRVSATPYYGLSEDGKAALYGLLDSSGRNAAYYLGHPQFDKDWIDDGMRFNSEWMCPENPDKDIYTVPGDEIRKHHGRGHDMTIKVMGDKNGCDEHVATITLKKAN